MNFDGTTVLTQSAKEQGLSQLERYAAGSQKLLTPFWEQSTDADFSKLSAAADAADGEANRDPSDPALRVKLAFAMAVFRDAEYGMAGRKFLKDLSIHSANRHLYESGKTAVLIEMK